MELRQCILVYTNYTCRAAEKGQGSGSGTEIDQAKESVSATLPYKEMMAGNAEAPLHSCYVLPSIHRAWKVLQ